MSLVKDVYYPAFFDRFTATLEQTLPSFNKQAFISQVYDEYFIGKEWKERMKHTTAVLHLHLSANFKEAVKQIEAIITKLRENNFGEDGLAFMIFPDYIETYGLNDLETSAIAFEFITQFVSCEFAVRPFVIKYGQQMIDHMIGWSLHPNYKVRRLASEGSRPRLPWAMAIPELKKDPGAILPLLENLKNDPSEWVRKSVANNLNDIAKDNPAIVLQIAKKWRGISKETDAIIKHGSRTLLKQGHTEILSHYGLDSANIHVEDLQINTPLVNIGAEVEFSFNVKNHGINSQTVRLEYAIYYMKANAKLARKVYKISERIFQPLEVSKITRKQSFKLITTRVFYTGEHRLAVIVNGKESNAIGFELI
jgi:3-methyladenine DNA glycosylase AlkC